MATAVSLRDTDEFVVPKEAFAAPDRVPSAQVHVQVGGLSHQGNVRTNNEDHFLVARFGRTLDTLVSNLAEEHLPGRHEDTGYGMLVADGIGGSAAGEIASRTAIQAMLRLVLSTPDWILRLDTASVEEVMRRMEERFRQISEHLWKQASSDPHLRGMGTTLTLACSLGLDLVICHVGDSRAYLFRNGRLSQLTRDMTLAQEMADAGLISAEDAETHVLRHTLTQCIGGKNQIKAEVEHLPLNDGDRILLCTDGLTDMVHPAEITDELNRQEPPQATCQALVDLALKAGGRDNVTVVLADYRVANHEAATTLRSSTSSPANVAV